jgi:hypothetical protein
MPTPPRKKLPRKNLSGSVWPGNSDGEVAKDLLERIFKKLTETASPTQQQDMKFFPHGIELIYFKVKVNIVEIELKVAGAAGVQDLLGGKEPISFEQIHSA